MKILTIFSYILFTLTVSIVSTSTIAQGTSSASGEIIEKCTYPQQPNIPNGSKAEMDDMLAAQKDIKAYQIVALKFRACIDNIIDVWRNLGGDKDAINQKKEFAVTFYNRSIADEEEVAALFNTAIRAFKGKK